MPAHPPVAIKAAGLADDARPRRHGRVYDRLKRTAHDRDVPVLDPFYGYGRVNAQRAVG